MRALVALAQALLPRRVFLALVAPVVAEARGCGWRGALRLLVAVVEQLARYALLVPRDWLAEADFVLRSGLRALLEPAAPAAVMEATMSLGDRMLSTEDPAARRRAIAGTAAIAVHAVLVVVAVVWSFVKVDELPAPANRFLSAVFYEQPKPPPAPKAPRAKDPAPPKARRATAEPAAPFVAPRAAAEPTRAQPSTDTNTGTDTDTGTDTGTGTDTDTGTGTGTGTGTDTGTGTGPAAPEPPLQFIPPTWRQPERIAGSDPAYTPEAKAARLDGNVTLKVCFDRHGVVTDAKVLRGMPMGMTEAAQAAVRTWRYRPYLVNGQPIRGCIATRFNFTLR